jgi:hypothetical protein
MDTTDFDRLACLMSLLARVREGVTRPTVNALADAIGKSLRAGELDAAIGFALDAIEHYGAHDFFQVADAIVKERDSRTRERVSYLRLLERLDVEPTQPK